MPWWNNQPHTAQVLSNTTTDFQEAGVFWAGDGNGSFPTVGGKLGGGEEDTAHLAA